MIRRLRRRHRVTWLVLAMLLPVLYLIALAARQPAPLVDELPAPLREAASPAEPLP
jgi:hypothetical protein